MQRVDISRPFHTRQGRCYPPAYERSQTNFGSNFHVRRADLLPNAVVDESTALFGFTLVDHVFDVIGGVQNRDSFCVTGFLHFSLKGGQPTKRRSI
jgi:hypothetical protein